MNVRKILEDISNFFCHLPENIKGGCTDCWKYICSGIASCFRCSSKGREMPSGRQNVSSRSDDQSDLRLPSSTVTPLNTPRISPEMRSHVESPLQFPHPRLPIAPPAIDSVTVSPADTKTKVEVTRVEVISYEDLLKESEALHQNQSPDVDGRRRSLSPKKLSSHASFRQAGTSPEETLKRWKNKPRLPDLNRDEVPLAITLLAPAEEGSSATVLLAPPKPMNYPNASYEAFRNNGWRLSSYLSPEPKLGITPKF